SSAKLAAFHTERVAAYRRGVAEGEERWDTWFENACTYVDWAAGLTDELPMSGLPGNPFSAETAAALETAARQPGRPLKFLPRTLSTSSTSSLACAFAGPPRGFAMETPRS